MAIETRTLELGEYTLTVTQMDALKGRKAFVKLANVFARSGAKMSADDVGASLGVLREADMEEFCDMFGALTTVSGGEYGDKTPRLDKALFMTFFAGKYDWMFDWLVFCVMTNFSSFFANLPGLVEKYTPGKTKSQLASTSPKA